MDLTTLTLIGVLGLLLGAGLAVGWARRAPSQVQTPELTALKEQLATHIAQLQAKEEQTLEMRQQREQVQRELEGLRQREVALTRELASLSTELDNERRHTQEKIQLLTQARESLSEQFRNLANDILEDKSKRFTETNAVRLGELLGPLGLKIAEFQKKVEHVYDTEGRARSELAGQVKQLMELNQVLSADAKNLTQALKGSNKAQGNWGELILERVLEGSGLRKGHEYVVQESHTREDGSRAVPDVVIRLPDERFLVVDAKVSLVAYEQAATQEDDIQREAAIKRHVESLRNHIRGLSSKNYQQIHDIRSLDFVMLFIPVEPAFMMAIAHDPDLYSWWVLSRTWINSASVWVRHRGVTSGRAASSPPVAATWCARPRCCANWACDPPKPCPPPGPRRHAMTMTPRLTRAQHCRPDVARTAGTVMPRALLA
ncbi:MAG: DNA recombination protein RmuC [Burkholderiaceae bacterium]|nr:DNA recombination protein RmuC [Burkholderiaceae bacterium]